METGLRVWSKLTKRSDQKMWIPFEKIHKHNSSKAHASAELILKNRSKHSLTETLPMNNLQKNNG